MNIENLYTSDFTPPPQPATNEGLDRQTLAIITGQLVSAEITRTGKVPDIQAMATLARKVQEGSDRLWDYINGYD